MVADDYYYDDEYYYGLEDAAFDGHGNYEEDLGDQFEEAPAEKSNRNIQSINDDRLCRAVDVVVGEDILKKEGERKKEIMCQGCKSRYNVEDSASTLRACARCDLIAPVERCLTNDAEYDAHSDEVGESTRRNANGGAKRKKRKEDQGFNWILSWDDAAAIQDRLLQEALSKHQKRQRTR